MKARKFYIRTLFLSLILLTGGTIARAECDQGRRFYDQALQTEDPHQRISLLKRSIDACERYGPYFELGRAYMAAGDLEKAQIAFRNALKWAGSDGTLAQSYKALGLLAEKQGDEGEAVRNYRKFLGFYPDPSDADLTEPVRRRMKDLLLSRSRSIMSAKSIHASLMQQRRNFEVVPSLDLYVRFDYDSDDLTSQGRIQADHLGRALSDPAYSGDTFRIIGHTDSQGDASYNQNLSERRARRVREYVLSYFPLKPHQIEIAGKGEEDLLIYPETSEDDYAINRRVQVEVR